jgi:hypothetical protein
MFIYEVKSADSCLMTKIVISGDHLVIYTNKPNSQELNGIMHSFNLESVVSGDHPAHIFCHNPYIKFSALGDSIPHKHFKFPPKVDRFDYLKQIFDFLVNRQNNQSLRKKDYDTFIFNLNEERQSYGHKQFPPEVQKAIDCYDLKTPYIPKDEIEVILASFSQYINCTHNMNIENISIHAEALLDKHWGIIYIKPMLSFEEKFSENETILCAYFDALLKLRENLLGTMSKPNNLDFYYKAANTLKKIQVNAAYLNDEKAFHKSIVDISHHINNKINSLDNYQSLVGFLGLSTCTLGYFLATEDSRGKAIFLGLLIPGLSALSIKYLEKPISNFISHTFFHKNNASEKGVAILSTDSRSLTDDKEEGASFERTT